jgi:hypothetical protein
MMHLPARPWLGVAAAALLAAPLLGASPASAAPDTQPPTAPHLYAVRGLGGCEINLRIGLSADNITPQPAIRYEVVSNGTVTATVRADTRGSKPGFGSLDGFASPAGGVQRLTVVAVDQAGNASAPSNAISRNIGPCA